MSKWKKEELESLSLKELVEAHNQIAEKPVKKFGSKGAGIKKILKAQDGESTPKAPKGEKKGKGRPRKGFNFTGKGSEKPPRDKSKRNRIVELTSRANGASIEELTEVTKRPRESLSILARHHGYTFTETSTGRIKLEK